MSAPASAADATPDEPGRRFRIVAGLLVAMHLAFGFHAACSKSVTHDELWHLPAGLVTLRTGRFDVDNLNPPLTRVWAALPLWIAGVSADDAANGPAVGSRFLELHPGEFQHWYVWGRLFNLILSVVAAVLLCRWACELMGKAAAGVALLLYCTCPNIAAHAAIVTPDIGLMTGMLASLWAFWHWLDRPLWRTALIAGVLTGMTQATKFTAVLLYPVLAVMALSLLSHPRRRTAAMQFAVIIAVSVLLLNAAYLFRGSGRPLGEYQFQSEAMQTVTGILCNPGRLPVPLPRDYVEGLDAQRAIMESPHPVFLDGQWSVTGFPSYYGKTLLYKLPHITQAIVLIGGLMWLMRPPTANPWRTTGLLILPVVLLLGIAGGSSMQLGVRYVLPILPLLMLWGGRAGAFLASCSRLPKLAGFAVLTVLCVSSLRHHPHHLAYFNEYAGGPTGGRHRLLDSNLDWGQDLHLVRQFMADRDLKSIGLAYFGTVPPESLGIDYVLPPGRTAETAATWSLPPGWYAVSVNYVMGRPHVIHQPDGGSHGVGLDEFGYFRSHEPAARLGHSIDVYHIGQEPAP